MTNKDTNIKDAQYRKGLSIAFFNANNAAISLLTTFGELKNATKPNIKKSIIYWRDFFLAEHQEYYASVIENVGKNYKVEETIARLEKAKNLQELKSLFISLAEDERQDQQVVAKKDELKKKYAKV